MTHQMSSRERIIAALKGQPVDRIPFMLWGLDSLQITPNPSYKPLLEYIAAHGDLKGL